MTDKIYFGRTNADPLDGLCDASSVLDMLSTFVSSSNDLSLFEYNPLNRSMNGLCVVLDSAQRAIEMVYEELLEEKAGDRAEPAVDQQTVLERDLPKRTAADQHPKSQRGIESLRKSLKDMLSKSEGSETGNETYPKLPALSARDTAIAETFRKGYSPEEIASAVNLKRITVERIIGKLKDAGTIPQEPDNLSHAASA